MYRLCFQIADILFDVTQRLQTLHWKRAVKSHCTKCQDSSETVNSVSCCLHFQLCYSMSYQTSIFQVFQGIGNPHSSADHCGQLSALPLLCNGVTARCTPVYHEGCRLWCTFSKEKVEKGWLLFLCADSQVGSQTSILLTLKAALKAMHDQAITLTNSAFSTWCWTKWASHFFLEDNFRAEMPAWIISLSSFSSE